MSTTYVPVFLFVNKTFHSTNKSNGSSFTTESPDAEIFYTLEWWIQLLWYIMFGGVVVVATGGNLIVIWIVLAHRRMRTVTNYFLVNLSIADTMVSTLNIIFNFTSMLYNHWPYGQAYCKISNFVAILSIAASVFSLMAISIDRYMAIIHPLKPRMSKKLTLLIAGIIWLSSAMLASPNISFSITVSKVENDIVRTHCLMEWPDGPTPYSYQEYIYNVVILVVTYILPITSMTFTYSRIGFELWGSQSIGECTSRQIESVKSKRRVVKMMIVVVVIFAVCWLPFHTYFLVSHHYPFIPNLPFIQQVYLFIYWLAMSNSMYNPLIYCWMNSRFRGGFKKVFHWCPGVKLTDTEMMYEKKPKRGTVHSNCSFAGDHRVSRNGTMKVPLYRESPRSTEIEFTEFPRTSRKVDL